MKGRAAAGLPALRGRLIVFEGIDGCGKTTQLRRCEEWLSRPAPGRAPRPVRALREPGSTPCGEAVRALLLSGGPVGARAEMLLYMAARAELYERVILPALDGDEIVLLDRSQYSTAAYQGAGLGLDIGAILALARDVTAGRLPERVLLFDLPVETARARFAGRMADAIERRDAAYFERVAEGYRALARAEPQRFTVLDARPDPDTVFRGVQSALADVL
ncbi:MAG TPA: dTMP kinase [Planctomycetota bacterium]|nr:dTMP kinase [Planctomycetota bacterium]